MPDLESCVVVGDKFYCYDHTSGRYVEARVEARLVFVPDSYAPPDAEKLIAMKRFNLVEAKNA